MPNPVSPGALIESRSDPPVKPCASRLLAVLDHIPAYAFAGPSRLARDAGVSRSSVWRVIRADIHQPSFRLVCLLTAVLEERFGRTIDPRELVSVDGTFPTPSVCELVGCKGCLPAHFYSDTGELKPEFRGIPVGEWSKTNAYLPRDLAT